MENLIGGRRAEFLTSVSVRRDGCVLLSSKPYDCETGVSGSCSIQGGGVRGEINGFSRGSRKRLMALAYRADPVGCEFVTLTVGRNFCDVEAIRKVFRAWVKRQKRANPEFGCIWRLELQERGAPHYHLMAWGLGDKSRYDWVDLVSFTHPCLDDLERYAYKAEAITSDGGVASYCSKYVAKVAEKAFPGRVWGREGKVPIVDDKRVALVPTTLIWEVLEPMGFEEVPLFISGKDERERLLTLVQGVEWERRKTKIERGSICGLQEKP